MAGLKKTSFIHLMQCGKSLLRCIEFILRVTQVDGMNCFIHQLKICFLLTRFCLTEKGNSKGDS